MRGYDFTLPAGAEETYTLIIQERPVPEDAPGLRQLLDLGLAAPNAVIPGHYIALDAQLAVQRLMAAEQEALYSTAQRMAGIAELKRLADQHSAERYWGGPASEFLPSADLMTARIDKAVSRAATEVLTAQPGHRKQKVVDSVMEQDVQLLLRGVRMKILYHASTRFNPAVKDYTREIIAHGGEIKVAHGPFQQIIILDAREAFIRNMASDDPEDHSGWHVRDLASVKYMREGYLTEWGRSEPWSGAASPKPAGLLSQRERQVLTLMEAGIKMAQIAHRLGISERTIYKTVAELQDRVGVETTLQLAIWWGKQLAAQGAAD
ncbi:helix-turn-helix transcriptional regulator [Streptomyces sp. NPDC048659]|uniref:helix-turn-helix transcriptional regulator n=1 Tax=Streptomyces sp. NPDC048659 TaxID=3155489 RepID=UPI0034309056